MSHLGFYVVIEGMNVRRVKGFGVVVSKTFCFLCLLVNSLDNNGYFMVVEICGRSDYRLFLICG